MINKCVLCDGQLNNSKARKNVLSCGYSGITHDQKRCWLVSDSQIQQSCASLLPLKGFKTVKKLQIYALIRSIGEASLLGLFSIERVIVNFSAEERSLLLNIIPIDSSLRDLILKIIDKNGLEIKPNLMASVNYEHLPSDLKYVADIFHKYLEARYALLISKGHKRSTSYVSRYMSDVVSFLNFMTDKGCVSWHEFNKQLLVSYLAEKDRKLSSSLKKFIKFIELKHSPFKTIKVGKPKRRGSILVETPEPKIISPTDLERFIADIKSKYSEPEYALAWMVCRMGLTLEKAYNLKLNHFKMNDNGELVFKPAVVWVALPKHMQKIIGKMIYSLLPDWYKTSNNALSLTPLFHHYIPRKEMFSINVLQRQSRVLRSSAIFSMMQKGHLDRVSITQTTGVSMKVITNLERLFTADLHRRLDPELIKQRNQHILGTLDE